MRERITAIHIVVTYVTNDTPNFLTPPLALSAAIMASLEIDHYAKLDAYN